MGKAREGERVVRALRGAALGALTLLLGLWALSGAGGGRRFDSGIDFDGREDDSTSGSYVPFGAVRTEGTRRPLRPLEMCSWETALEVGQGMHMRTLGGAEKRLLHVLCLSAFASGASLALAWSRRRCCCRNGAQNKLQLT